MRNLGSDPKRKHKKSRCDDFVTLPKETVTAFPEDDGELDVDGGNQDDELPDPSTDDITIEEGIGPLTQAQRDALLKIHENIGHPARA